MSLVESVVGLLAEPVMLAAVLASALALLLEELSCHHRTRERPARWPASGVRVQSV